MATERGKMRIEKAYWLDHKPSDNNKGYIYGINYIDNEYNENESGDIVECEWFKTKAERNNKYKIEKRKYETK